MAQWPVQDWILGLYARSRIQKTEKNELQQFRIREKNSSMLEGVQFLSDELSEVRVSKNRQLTVQFLRADFAAVSEVTEKISAEF